MTKDKVIGTIKSIVGKLPIFLFCVLFIKAYTGIFGNENSIVGVTILTGLLIFLKNDFGYNVKHAAGMIPIMFLIVAISPKIANINPFLGIIVNFISMSLILVLSSHDLSMDNHVTFLMGYLFCQGYDVSGELYTKRIISVLVGGILVALIYFLIKHKKTYKRNISDLFKEIDVYSTRTQWHLKLATALTLVMFLGDILNYPRAMWINLAVLSLIQPSSDVKLARAKHRIPATIIGSVAFVVIFQILVPDEYKTIAMMVAGFVTMLMNSYFTKTIMNSFTALMTAVVFFSSKEAVSLRIIANILGVVFALLYDKFADLMFNKLPK